VGEGGPDGLLMPLVDRVSIACGGHAGDVASMRQALLRAKELGIQPGAHPGYPDPANFGRKPMAAAPTEISAWIVGQTRALISVADGLDMQLFHVKPHGALYNQAAKDEAIGKAVIAALQELGGLTLIALAGSPLVEWARATGLGVMEEAFADRRYLKNGQLSPRAMPGAVIEQPDESALQAMAISRGWSVATLDGQPRVIKAQTLCVHGDGPGAMERARAVALALGNSIRQRF
jgi:UPF0271 protein